MSDERTLMVVHAHPDDEVITTGGSFVRYGEEGVRTVLVVCTNGEQGDGPGGVKPGEDGHDEAAVREQRLTELQESVRILGIKDVELLGYHDSGMDGWEGNQRPDAFRNVPVADAATRLAELMVQYRPQVVVTYDENGNYGHPDHIMANRITVAAVDLLRERSDPATPAKLYYTAIPRSGMTRIREALRESHPELVENEMPEPEFGMPDELITTVLNTMPYVERKKKALTAHASQTENLFFFQFGDDMLAQIFGQEAFVLQGATVPTQEDDLFAGLD